LGCKGGISKPSIEDDGELILGRVVWEGACGETGRDGKGFRLNGRGTVRGRGEGPVDEEGLMVQKITRSSKQKVRRGTFSYYEQETMTFSWGANRVAGGSIKAKKIKQKGRRVKRVTVEGYWRG